MVSERGFHGLMSGIGHAAPSSTVLPPRSPRSASRDRTGSSMVITLLAPRSPHGGGAPSPTRIVITGNGGASSGHGVWQSVTMTRRSIGPALPLA